MRSVRVKASDAKPGRTEFNAPWKCIPGCLCVYHFLVICVVFAAYVWMDLESSQMDYDYHTYYSNLEHIIYDWDAPLITNIEVFDLKSNNGSCPAGYEPLFTKIWEGLDQSCNCIQNEIDNNNYQLNTPIDYSSFIKTKQNKCSDTC